MEVIRKGTNRFIVKSNDDEVDAWRLMEMAIKLMKEAQRVTVFLDERGQKIERNVL